MVSGGHVSHLCQFREDQDGERYPMFPVNRAVIKLSDVASRYEVRSIHGELLFAGRDLDEAVARIKYAQGHGVDITVNVGGKQSTLKQYEARIAPTIFRIRYTRGKATDVYGVAMDVSKDGEVLAEWSFARTGEDATANEIIRLVESQPKKGKNFAVVFSHEAIPAVVDHFGKKTNIPPQDFKHLVEKSRIARQAFETKLQTRRL